MSNVGTRVIRIDKDRLIGRDGDRYIAHPDLITAAETALALKMPLLLTGEPGTGKTDFAFAVKNALVGESDPLHECYVRSDTRAQDLLYSFDSLTRFADAQTTSEAGARKRAENPRNYVTLKGLGRGLLSPELSVVLVDEIDKAPRDLPNDLLQEMDQGRFEIPELNDGAEPLKSLDVDDRSTYRFQMRAPGDQRPLVVITSNVERQLPDPFLRRCIFFHIPFPNDDQLTALVKDRFGDQPLIKKAVTIFLALRATGLKKRPSTSELINWFGALSEVQKGQRNDEVDEFAEQAAKTKRPLDLPWRDLPALYALVKLREDLDTLGALPRH